MVHKQRQLHLSFLDQLPHIRAYVRHLVFFPFPDLAYADAAINAIRTGLAATLCTFPYLAGTIEVPDPLKGRLKLMYPDPIEPGPESLRLFTASFSVAASPQFDNDMLAKESIPPSRLPSDVFCPSLLKHHPGLDDDDPFAEKMVKSEKGIPVPAFAAQATMIPGGLVLSLWMHHAVADGTGCTQLYRTWSMNVRAITEQSHWTSGRKDASLESNFYDGLRPGGRTGGAHDDPSSARRALDVLVCDSYPKLSSPAPQRRAPQLCQTPYKVVTKLFRIASSTVSDLIPILSAPSDPALALTSSTERRTFHISRFTALSALLWAHITRARSALLQSQSIPSTTLAIVVDLRKHLGAPFTAPDYLGNVVLSAMPTWPLTPRSPVFFPRIITAQDLAPLAQQVARSLASVDKTWAIAHLASVASTEPPTPDVHGLTFPNGPDLYITSWERMSADCEWCIPGTSSAKPGAIRRAAWASEGGIVVLPRQKSDDAPYEILVSLAEEDMQAFEQGMRDGGWLEDTSAGTMKANL